MSPIDWVHRRRVSRPGSSGTASASAVTRTQMDGYFLASRSLPWWAVGLSVMATQLSAITMTSTTGQGYADGMRFVQFYFGLPIAMIVLSVTVVPFFWRAKVYTAYEYLERRFDLKTRTLTAILFLDLARPRLQRRRRGAGPDPLDRRLAGISRSRCSPSVCPRSSTPSSAASRP